jgi:hypothetical protein
MIKSITPIIAGLLFFLISGCDQHPKPIPNQPVVEDQANAVKSVFIKAKNMSQTGGSSADLKLAYEQLTDPQIKELSAEHDNGHYFLHYLALCKADAAIAAMVEHYLNKLEASVAVDQISKQAGGKDPLKMLYGTGRPTGENPDDAALVMAQMLPHTPTRVNDFKDAAGTFDSQSFNRIMAKVKTAKTKSVMDKLDAANFTSWMGWAMANPAASKASFKMVYGISDAPRQMTMRTKLLATLYGAVDFGDPAVSQIMDPADEWALRQTVGTDTYELADKAGAATFQGSLLHVLTKRAIDDQAAAGGAVLHTEYANLRSFATAIRAAMNNDVTYVDLATIQTFGLVNPRSSQDSLKDVIGKGLTAHYLALPDAEKYVFDAAADVTVTAPTLKNIYLTVIDNPAKAATLATYSDPVTHDSFLHRLAARLPTAEIFDVAKDFLTSLSPAERAAQVTAVNTAGHSPVLMWLAAAPMGASQPHVDKLRLLALSYSDVATIEALIPPDMARGMTSLFAEFGGPDAAAAKSGFQAVYAAVNINTKERMRNGLLEAAWALGPNEVNDLINSIASATDDLGLHGDLKTAPYTVTIAGVLVTGNILFVLTQMAIRQATPADFTPLKTLKDQADALWTILGDADYFACATTDTTGAGSPDSAFSIFNTTLAPTHPGYAQYYLQVNQGPAAIDENMVMAAADQVHPQNEVLRWLYKQAIDSEAKAVALNGLLGPVTADNFINRLVFRQRVIDQDIEKILKDFLTKLGNHAEANGFGLDAPGLVARKNAMLAQVTTPGPATPNNALEKLVDSMRNQTGPRLGETIAYLAQLDDGTGIAGINDENDALNLLEAVSVHGSFEEVQKTMVNLDNVVAHVIGRWAVHNAMQGHILDNGGIATGYDIMFRAEYANRNGPTKTAMRNYIFDWVFNNAAASALNTAIKHVVTDGGPVAGNPIAAEIDRVAPGTAPAILSAIEAEMQHRPVFDAVQNAGGMTPIVLGAIKAELAKIGLRDEAFVVSKDFFTLANLTMNDFDPFTLGEDATLLFALLMKANVMSGVLGEDIVKNDGDPGNLIEVFKAKVGAGANWQTYLTTNNNLLAGQSIETLVAADAGDQVTARIWLDY